MVTITPEQRINGNRTIAQFDGWKSMGLSRRGLFGKKTEYFKRGKREPMPFITTFKYDSSWDALMPIVKKVFKKMKGNGSQELMKLHIPSKIGAGLMQVNINAVWIAVIEFIEWYNKQWYVTQIKTTS